MTCCLRRILFRVRVEGGAMRRRFDRFGNFFIPKQLKEARVRMVET
jgi:hypothetical protein